jgi:hypothetical protein
MERIVRSGVSPDLVKFATVLDRPAFEDDPLAVTNEWMWARSLGGNHYEVENIPFFARGFSRSDLITCVAKSDVLDGSLVFESVLKRGGHSTYRIQLREQKEYSPNDKYMLMRHLDLLIKLGCEFELGDFGLIAVDVGPAMKLGAVAEVLKSGYDDGIWNWQKGHIDENNPAY